jgi:hypothetical protein
MEETLLEKYVAEIELYKRLVDKQKRIINELKIQIVLKDKSINFKTAAIAELKDMVNEACDIGDRQIKERAIR